MEHHFARGCFSFLEDMPTVSKNIGELSDRLSSNAHPMVNGFIPEERLNTRRQFLCERNKQQYAALFLLTHGCQNCRARFRDPMTAMNSMVDHMRSRLTKAEALQKDISARHSDIEKIRAQLDAIAQLREYHNCVGRPPQVYGVDALSDVCGPIPIANNSSLNGTTMPPTGPRRGGGLALSRHFTGPTHTPYARTQQVARGQQTMRGGAWNNLARGGSATPSGSGTVQTNRPGGTLRLLEPPAGLPHTPARDLRDMSSSGVQRIRLSE
ncbi:hypothetical protein F4775DRAFT_547727 [Biscogniauxia sp. FL1348]|nr:hypothetical protein F4775DRAFT_547727 [Biscogniauxia sp. FL1348]